MIFSHKYLVIFGLNCFKNFMNSKAFILTVLFILTSMVTVAQNDETALKKSKDYIYEANEMVEEDFVRAEKEYRKAISKAPNYAVGNYNLANAMYGSELYDEAYLKLFEAAKNATTKEEKHKAYHNAGNVLMKQELCQEAVEMFKNALRNDPTDDETRYNFALAKECAKDQGGGEGDDDSEDKKEEQKQEENQDQNDDQQDEGDNEDNDKNDGNEQEDQNQGDDNEDENGKPQDEQDNKEQNNPSDRKKKQQQQPGKLSPQQVKNLLEAMNNQEKKVQEKINAKKAKGARVEVEKDW